MRLLSGLFLTGFGVVFAYGWACWLVPRERRGKLGTDTSFQKLCVPSLLELALVTMGLSLGGLTLWMFWVALVLPGRLSLATALVGALALAAGGLWASWRDWTP